MKALAKYQIILLGEQRHIGVNNLPKVIARQIDNAAAGS